MQIYIDNMQYKYYIIIIIDVALNFS